ncbi:MAG TPA: signal peptidase I [Thermoflexia bacterium]|nr:signal peptidase I [Thermoflexia bacterium]
MRKSLTARSLSAEQAADLGSWLRDLIETLLLAVLIYFLINTLTGRYQVLSVSMEPTLHEGQYIIVNKASYWLHAPERGDIVVFAPPNGAPHAIPLIKRIIGLPGEHLAVHEGRVLINGQILNEPYISGPPSYQQERALAVDEYFVLGDNRNNSSDSHSWGTVPPENFIGKAVFRYWPPDKFGLFPHYIFSLEEATQ